MQTNNKGKKILWEMLDVLTGAAFPFMLQLVFSASVILFADYGATEIALGAVILVIGELLMGAAYFICGRQNGVIAVRRGMQNAKKTAIGSNDLKAELGIGEYALYKGVVIGLVTCLPFMLVQFIDCFAHNRFCEFILKYAFGWAAMPFALVGKAVEGGISAWLNFIWIVYPVAVHTFAYWFGAAKENKRRQIEEQAQEAKANRKK